MSGKRGRLGFLARPGFHLALAIAWTVLLVPTLLWWKNSILWVCLMSDYALIAAHWASYQGARAERQARESGSSDSAGESKEAV